MTGVGTHRSLVVGTSKCGGAKRKHPLFVFLVLKASEFSLQAFGTHSQGIQTTLIMLNSMGMCIVRFRMETM